jgi:hypothetical protein
MTIGFSLIAGINLNLIHDAGFKIHDKIIIDNTLVFIICIILVQSTINTLILLRRPVRLRQIGPLCNDRKVVSFPICHCEVASTEAISCFGH